jgi:hypothetical protein
MATRRTQMLFLMRRFGLTGSHTTAIANLFWET